MKILYIITSTETGGAEKALAELALYMAPLHTVKIISLKTLGVVGKALQQKGIEVTSLEMKWYSLRIIQRLAAQIKAFQPDLVHAMLYRAIEYARVACAGTRIPVLSTPHFDLSKKSFALRWTDFILKDLDTLTVAESFTTARYLVEHQKYQKEKVYLLPNGADPKRFFPDEHIRLQMRQTYGLEPHQPVIISVGRLAPVKDPLTLLQAFRNLLRTVPAARLIYVGEGPERVQLEQYIRMNQLQQSVFLVGEQLHINDWLNMADIFVLSSVEESLPLALLEALRAGLPCVVSRVGDMPLWVEHGKNGFVFYPQDITLLSCLLTELAQHEELRRTMGRQSLEIAKRMTDSSPQYQHLYQQIKDKSFHVKTNR